MKNKEKGGETLEPDGALFALFDVVVEALIFIKPISYQLDIVLLCFFERHVTFADTHILNKTIR